MDQSVRPLPQPVASVDDQSGIASWFDRTYTNRGLRYLRPVQAYHLFLSLMQVKPGGRLLDVACGPGQLLLAADAFGARLSGIDISSVAVDLCRKRLPQADVHCGNAEQLPFPENTFDYITCLGSLERFIDREKALREQFRVADPDARFCYLVRNAQSFKWRFFKEKLRLKNEEGHQDALTLDAWRSLFEKTGFEIIHILPDHWPAMKWRHYLRLGLGVPLDYSAAPASGRNLSRANEFIFLLRKRTHG
jgi:ubiquinone/menaquinone biosynthesis C-methylase UbiE